MEAAMSLFQPVNLLKWVEQHKDQLQPPVGNKMVWRDERGTIVMIVGGPNARNDYHVNATEEFFYQIQGDITLGIIRPDTGKPDKVVIREGEIYLLPANVPHSPRRPANTIGMVVEQPRPEETTDKLRWYCESCGKLVYEAEFLLANIEIDLKRIMDTFWSDEKLRRCRCGAVVQRPGEAQPPPKA
jgi:3-hydroxyanthranilate 3,4-dioxygenase